MNHSAIVYVLLCVPAAAAGGPKLSLSASSWDFGTRWQGQPTETRLELKNVGDAELQLTDVRTDCGCTAAKPTRNTLPPGEACDLVIQYDTFRPDEIVRKRVHILTNEPGQPPRTIEVTGRVRPVVRMEPADGLNFDVVSGRTAVSRSVELHNEYSQPLALKVDQHPPGISLSLEELEPGQRWRLTAATVPPLNDGSIKKIAALQTGNSEVAEVRFQILGVVRDRVVVLPPQIVVGDRAPAAGTRPIRVLPRGGQPLRIVSVQSSDPHITTRILPPPETQGSRSASAPISIEVVLPPAEQIAEGATIRIQTDDPEFPSLEVPVVRQ
ncbi:MAG: DUF1573 domain-containing protein [Phycisphaerae bacterium]